MAEDPYMVVVNQEAERGRARSQGPGAKCMSSSSAFPSSSFFFFKKKTQFVLFYVYGCLSHMYVSASCSCLSPWMSQEGARSSVTGAMDCCDLNVSKFFPMYVLGAKNHVIQFEGSSFPTSPVLLFCIGYFCVTLEF